MIDSSTNTIKIPIEIATEDSENLQAVKSSLSTVASAARSPGKFMLGELTSMIPEIATALVAAGLIEELAQKLFEPGGPFDIRFRRELLNERDNLFSLQEQQAKRIGLNQVIFTSGNGFANLNGANVENTLKEVHNYGVSKLGLQDKSQRISP